MEKFRDLVINDLSKTELLDRLLAKGVQFNKYAKLIFDDPAFTPGKEVE